MAVSLGTVVLVFLGFFGLPSFLLDLDCLSDLVPCFWSCGWAGRAAEGLHSSFFLLSSTLV